MVSGFAKGKLALTTVRRDGCPSGNTASSSERRPLLASCQVTSMCTCSPAA